MFFSLTVIAGRRVAPDPGGMCLQRVPLDFGFAPFARPGMTGVGDACAA
jgi:hypothetical protein